MAVTTQLSTTIQQIQVLANDLNLLAGQVGVTVNTLQTGLNNGTAFATAPDYIDAAKQAYTTLVALQSIQGRLTTMKTALTIPT